MREKISACVTAGNEEQKIERCLRSLTWCDEIVVVDSYSTDRTVEICKRFTDRVYQHEWLGYIGQKNLIRDMAKYPWILFLDADEEVSPELQREILSEFERGSTNQYNGFQFPRQVFYLNKWIRHGEWYPDIKLRLFRKEYGRSAGQEPHDHVVVNGRVKTLKGHLRHYTYDGIHDHLETMDRFSTITAKEKYRQGDRFRLTDFIFRPIFRFFKAYFLRTGFLDGLQGFIIALVSAFGVTMKYAKMWEIQLNQRTSEPARTAPPQTEP